MWQEFASISIDHCNRESNIVVHDIANLAMASKLSCNWVDEPPSSILETLLNYVTLFGD